MGRKKKEVEVEEVVVGTEEQVMVVDSVLPVDEEDELGFTIFQDPATGVFHRGKAAPGGGMESASEVAAKLTKDDAVKILTSGEWVEQTPEVVAKSETDRVIAELREQVAGLQRQFNHVPMLTPRQQEALNVAEEIGELTMFVIEAESKFDKLDKEAKAAKKAFEAARDDMQAANERLHEITSGGDYQRRLFPTYPSTDFTTHAESLGQPVSAVAEAYVEVEQVAVDVGGSVSLDDFNENDLSRHNPSHTKDGLTAKKIEALKAEVGETVADLESWLQAGYRLDEIKGFGPEWVTRTMDALGVIRDRYPVPEEATLEAIDSEAAELVESAAYEDEMPDKASFDAVVSLGEDGMKIDVVTLDDELEDE